MRCTPRISAVYDLGCLGIFLRVNRWNGDQAINPWFQPLTNLALKTGVGNRTLAGSMDVAELRGLLDFGKKLAFQVNLLMLRLAEY